MLQILTAPSSHLLRRSLKPLVAAVCVVVLWASPAAAQFFSPGPLARAHGALEGIDNCAKCHEQQKGLSARLCLDCHTELQGRVAKDAGFHGRLPAAKKQDCQSCHPDHRGVDFSMIEWEGGRDRFDHQKTGWPLKGGHAKARCDDCHQKRLILDAAIARLLEKQPQRKTLLGAPSRCDACHFDEHRGELSRDCQRCHDETTWKPAPRFDHQKSDYPLLGKHKVVACAKCHPNEIDDRFVATAFPKPRAASFMQMKPIEFKSCESCHADPHKGTLGPACSSCHVEDGWKIIKVDKGRDTSFHDKTKFPLRGGHVGVACKSCHGPFPGQPARFKGLAFGACSDCHEDAHLGQLRPKPPAKVVACEGCHSVNAFVPARYELEQHQSTKFALDGGHMTTPCRGCHPIDEGLAARIPAAVHQRLQARHRPERFSFAVLRPKKSPLVCGGCHEDVHRGQFAGTSAARERGGDVCTACHKSTSFAELTFDHDKDSRFPLQGKHAETACGSCHLPQRLDNGTSFVRYRPLQLGCGSCHTDYHQGQFLVAASTPRAKSRKPEKVRGCDFCHETVSFKESIFDHNDPAFSAYPLDGRHVKVKCAGCHPTVSVTSEIETVRYRPLPRRCESCHSDFHHGTFRGFEP